MARQFPHAEVVGLDLVPPILVTEDEIPVNCRFEVDDANLSLDHFEQCFDLVHMRSADTGLNDLKGWFYEIARTLRPGGILIICNGSAQKHDADLRPLPVTYPGQPRFSWVQHTWGVIYDGYHSKGNTAVENPLYWDEYAFSLLFVPWYSSRTKKPFTVGYEKTQTLTLSAVGITSYRSGLGSQT
ncbi:hypothetical protein FS837_002477 [Tulasnella sp. UAMH 9824]|nr:hypothetical protein FS837_002477 [Tulasnella sp. UAMH 9824]